MPKGKHERTPKTVTPGSVENTYFKETTDFDQVALFNQLLTNIFDRNRNQSITEVLDYVLEGGLEMTNKELFERTNKIGMRMKLREPAPNEGNKKTE